METNSRNILCLLGFKSIQVGKGRRSFGLQTFGQWTFGLIRVGVELGFTDSHGSQMLMDATNLSHTSSELSTIKGSLFRRRLTDNSSQRYRNRIQQPRKRGRANFTSAFIVQVATLSVKR